MGNSIRRLAIVSAVSLAMVGGSTATAIGSAGGDSNKGDVWLDNVGQPPGPGHEMDPHLACADINLWGDKLADPSGTYTIDGWPPSGSKQQAYSSTWSYNQSQGGSQVISVINVKTLIANAAANGDQPAAQGYHFKLQFSQDPQKHKTFWVKCPAPSSTTSGGTTSGGNNNGGGNNGNGNGNNGNGNGNGNGNNANNTNTSNTPSGSQTPATAPVSGSGTLGAQSGSPGAGAQPIVLGSHTKHNARKHRKSRRAVRGVRHHRVAVRKPAFTG